MTNPIRASLKKPRPILHARFTTTAFNQAEKYLVKNNSATVTIKTPRLTMRSLNQYSLTTLESLYQPLLSSPVNVEKLRDGKPWPKDVVSNFLATQLWRWNKGEKYGVFAAFLEDNTQPFIGTFNCYFHTDTYANVGAGYKNVVEIGYCIDEKYWNQRYTLEMTEAAIKHIEYTAPSSDPKPTAIVATVQPDNINSEKILKRYFTQEENPIGKFGKTRLFYHRPILEAAIDKTEKHDFENRLLKRS
jgi:RimJ/RimL family protein N-acetyltransferase